MSLVVDYDLRIREPSIPPQSHLSTTPGQLKKLGFWMMLLPKSLGSQKQSSNLISLDSTLVSKETTEFHQGKLKGADHPENTVCTVTKNYTLT